MSRTAGNRPADPGPRIDPDPGLQAGFGSWHVRRVAVTGSTNADLLAAADSAADRTVLVADHQTAGRGRLDRRWEAPPGVNLLCSILFTTVPRPPSTLTQRIGLSIARAARTFAPDAVVELKWPNDVLLGGAKLAGVLAQLTRRGDRPVAVVGFGVNVGWAPPGAARLVAGSDRPGPVDVLAHVLAAFDALPADPDELGACYRESLGTLGRDVRVDLPDGTAVIGRATDVDAEGRLVVEAVDGARAFDVGDIVHLRPAPPSR